MKRLIFVLMLLFAVKAEATTRYVDAGCTNGLTTYVPATRVCTGGSATVYTTLTNASASTVAGDTVEIRAGTYSTGLNCQTATCNSGTSGSHITWKAYSGEAVTINQDIAYYGTGKSFIDWNLTGITIDLNKSTSRTGCINLSGSSGVPKVLPPHDIVIDGGGTGVCRESFEDGMQIFGGYNITIKNMSFVDNGSNSSASGQHGVYAGYGNTGLIIENNTFNDSGDYAIQIYDGDAGQSVGTIVRNNTILNSACNTNFSEGGIVVGGLGNPSNVQIYNNRLYNFLCSDGGSQGIWVLKGTGTKIWNNSIQGNGFSKGIWVGTGGVNTQVINNISYGWGTQYLNEGSGTTCSTNQFNCSTGASSYNPSFVSTTDQHLTAGSSAIGGGTSLAASFTTDIVGTSRPQGTNWDIGAYEYISPPAALTLLSPNGGESFTIGSTQTVLWSSNGAGATVEITEDADGNGSYETTITASTANDGSHSYTVGGSANASRKMKVKDTAAATNDVSDAVYAATSSTPGTLTFTYPTSGLHYFPGDTIPLTWTSAGISGNVNIYISYTNGTYYQPTAVVGTFPFNQPDATWTVSGPSGTQVKFKIVSANDTAVYGESAAIKIAGTALTLK